MIDAGQCSSQFISLLNHSLVQNRDSEVCWRFLLYCVSVKEDLLFVSDYMVLIDLCLRILMNEGEGCGYCDVLQELLKVIVRMKMYNDKVGKGDSNDE